MGGREGSAGRSRCRRTAARRRDSCWPFEPGGGSGGGKIDALQGSCRQGDARRVVARVGRSGAAQRLLAGPRQRWLPWCHVPRHCPRGRPLPCGDAGHRPAGLRTWVGPGNGGRRSRHRRPGSSARDGPAPSRGTVRRSGVRHRFLDEPGDAGLWHGNQPCWADLASGLQLLTGGQELSLGASHRGSPRPPDAAEQVPAGEVPEEGRQRRKPPVPPMEHEPPGEARRGDAGREPLAALPPGSSGSCARPPRRGGLQRGGFSRPSPRGGLLRPRRPHPPAHVRRGWAAEPRRLQHFGWRGRGRGRGLGEPLHGPLPLHPGGGSRGREGGPGAAAPQPAACSPRSGPSRSRPGCRGGAVGRRHRPAPRGPSPRPSRRGRRGAEPASHLPRLRDLRRAPPPSPVCIEREPLVVEKLPRHAPAFWQRTLWLS
mmetsp:Transcript_42535/g.100955  ORF Transcript_42535/g.100955 Transcript_42535/m.100955 type:complete len:428 (-) Transcript_42535:36-1319(-)